MRQSGAEHSPKQFINNITPGLAKYNMLDVYGMSGLV